MQFMASFPSVEQCGPAVWRIVKKVECSVCSTVKRYSKVQPVQFAVCPLCGGGVYLLIPSHLDTGPHR